jgi:hypothetical protein
MKDISLRSRFERWLDRNWYEIKMDLMSACMGICFFLLAVLFAAMLVEGFSIGH